MSIVACLLPLPGLSSLLIALKRSAGALFAQSTVVTQHQQNASGDRVIIMGFIQFSIEL